MKLVYDDKKYTLAQIKESLDASWEGYEQIHRATPNVRLAYVPLSDAMSPTQGADIKGATAVIKLFV